MEIPDWQTKIMDLICDGKREPVTIFAPEDKLNITLWNTWKDVKETGISEKEFKRIVYVFRRALEDEEWCEIYILHEPEIKENWVAVAYCKNGDEHLFQFMEENDVYRVCEIDNAIRDVRDMAKALRPHGRLFGPKPSVN